MGDTWDTGIMDDGLMCPVIILVHMPEVCSLAIPSRADPIPEVDGEEGDAADRGASL